VVRKYSWSGDIGYYENTAGHLESRSQNADFAIEFQNADRFNVGYNGFYEYLPAPFRIAPGVTLPVGGYPFESVGMSFTGAQRRPVSGTVAVERGTFYNGHKTTLDLAGGRVNLGPRFSVEPTYSVNKVDLVQGKFTTQLLGSRITWTTTPLMFTSALLQYNSGTHIVSANVRLRWEYRPGSELFVVLNEERDSLGQRFPDLTNRAFIVKVNRLLRF
jgi:hypothetical protein